MPRIGRVDVANARAQIFETVNMVVVPLPAQSAHTYCALTVTDHSVYYTNIDVI